MHPTSSLRMLKSQAQLNLQRYIRLFAKFTDLPLLGLFTEYGFRCPTAQFVRQVTLLLLTITTESISYCYKVNRSSEECVRIVLEEIREVSTVLPGVTRINWHIRPPFAIRPPGI
jgi:hypothetical protein